MPFKSCTAASVQNITAISTLRMYLSSLRSRRAERMLCTVCQGSHLPLAFDTQVTQAHVIDLIDPWPSFQPYQIFRTLHDATKSAAQGCDTCKHIVDCLPDTLALLAKPEKITVCLAGSSSASYPQLSEIQGHIHIPVAPVKSIKII